MKRKIKESFIPPERHETIRQKIISLIEEGTLSAKEISAGAGISEREVFSHLEHIQRTLGKGRHGFVVKPAVCKKCGFIFRKRDRLNKPGKCPVCHGESIQEPLFFIENK
jgi:predicted Zn-ribbon and HTH transcriptional regulator